MRVDALERKELLELDPGDDLIHLAGPRALIFDAMAAPYVVETAAGCGLDLCSIEVCIMRWA